MAHSTSSQPAAFLSYTHFDDDHNKGMITEFRVNLAAEVKAQTGDEFIIFQDKEQIEWGQNWRGRLDKAISAITFLIPIITPSFFKSPACREEVEKFLIREKELNRDDLILPLYLIDTPLMNDKTKRATDPLAEELSKHQYADWRQLRFEPFTSPQVRKALEKLALQIRSALERSEALNDAETIQKAEILPPGDELGLVEAQKAIQGLMSLFQQIAEDMGSSNDAVNKKIEQINQGQPESVIAPLIAYELNNGTTKLNKLVPGIAVHLKAITNFYWGYIFALDAELTDDREELISLRDQFIQLAETFRPAIDRLYSLRSSGSKLRISSEVIRANTKRNECMRNLFTPMEMFHTFLLDAIETIERKLRNE